LTSAYVDTSCIVATAFGEKDAATIARRLSRFDRVLSSPLLEAELFSALLREGREVTGAWSSAIEYVIVDRPLSSELSRVLAAGYLRGADCWHLATALYLAPDPSQLAFVTLDATQRKVARALGFQI
jgi:predicted nucleic acid-binding protein